jgi:uncharacterized membrane protein YdbT with pleckstrin-like domain
MSYIANSLQSDEVVLINVPTSDAHLAQITAILIIFVWLLMFMLGLLFALLGGVIGGFFVTLGKAAVALIAVITLLATVGLVYQWLVIKHFVEQAVTSHRVIYKEGLFFTNTYELRLDALESVTMFQSFLEKIVGCGRLGFTGRGGSGVPFVYVDNPVHTRKTVEDVIRQQSQNFEEKET